MKRVSKTLVIRLFLLLGMLGLFLAALYYRQHHLGALICKTAPESCTIDQLQLIDRWAAIAPGDIRNQRFSDLTQHAAIIWVFILLWMWAMSEGRKVWDKVILIFFALLANSAFNEVIRITFPRPRPYVLHNLELSGFAPGDYTSFYSGHTSFVTVLMAMSAFFLKSSALSKPWINSHNWVAAFLIVLTALNRVWGGQHFVTDVTAAVIIGMWISWLCVRIDRFVVGEKVR